MHIIKIAKFKSAFLVLAMLTFSVVMISSQVAGGRPGTEPCSALAQVNVEWPQLCIDKTKGGPPAVPTDVEKKWRMKIKVAYSRADTVNPINNVTVEDTIPAGVDMKLFSVAGGTVTIDGTPWTVGTWIDNNDGVSITWDIGTLDPGKTATLVMKVNTTFTTPGDHDLNEGAIVTGIHPINNTVITAGPTDPITIYAKP